MMGVTAMPSRPARVPSLRDRFAPLRPLTQELTKSPSGRKEEYDNGTDND
jgi:hypothetical protein